METNAFPADGGTIPKMISLPLEQPLVTVVTVIFLEIHGKVLIVWENQSHVAAVTRR